MYSRFVVLFNQMHPLYARNLTSDFISMLRSLLHRDAFSYYTRDKQEIERLTTNSIGIQSWSGDMA